MGRIFLVAIVVGLVWGGYKVYQNIAGLTDPDALASRYHAEPPEPRQPDSEKPEGQDSGAQKKTAPARSSSEEFAEKPDPLPVLASTDEFLHVEAWGPAAPGDELPDGSILRSWSNGEALVTSQTGQLERRRFRRFNEALALVAPVMASAVQPSAPAVPGSSTLPTPPRGSPGPE